MSSRRQDSLMRKIPENVTKAIANRQISALLNRFKLRYPLLTQDEEIELSAQVQAGIAIMQRYEEMRDSFAGFDLDLLESADRQIWQKAVNAKNKIIRHNMRLVVHVAYNQGYFLSERLEPEDLIQAGSMGLNRAAEKFDGTKGYKFSTYAYFWVRQAMLRSMQNESRAIRLPLHLQAEIITLRKFVSRLSSELGKNPSKQEIVEYVNEREILKRSLTIERLDHLLRNQQSIRSLDSPAYGADDECSILHVFPDDTAADPLENAERSLQIERLNRLIAENCDEKERLILRERYLAAKPKTYKQIAKSLDMPLNTLRAIEQRLLRRLSLTAQTSSVLAESLDLVEDQADRGSS